MIIFSLGRIYFTSNDGSQNKFAYQPTLVDTLEFKKEKVMIMFLVGNQREYIILNLSHYILLSYIAKKLSGYKVGIKFDKDALAVERNNYLTKIVKFYIVYDLDAWPKNPISNFKFKNCLYGATSVVKNSDKEKYIYSEYGITLDRTGSWSFDIDFARNVIFFGPDNSSSC